LKELKESLYNVRMKLNTTLGLLDWWSLFSFSHS
jgi:hypothetical protein